LLRATSSSQISTLVLRLCSTVTPPPASSPPSLPDALPISPPTPRGRGGSGAPYPRRAPASHTPAAMSHSPHRQPSLARLGLSLVAVMALAVAGAEAFFLPSGAEVHNTGDPQVRVDSGGGVHLVYPLVAAAGAVYGYCPADCSGPEQVRTITFPTGELGAVHTALLALDGHDVPHVLISTRDAVVYGACEGPDCGDGAYWRTNVVYRHDGNWELTGDAFAIDPRGGPTFLMHEIGRAHV